MRDAVHAGVIQYTDPAAAFIEHGDLDVSAPDQNWFFPGRQLSSDWNPGIFIIVHSSFYHLR